MNFRNRYAALEARRADFVARLTAFDETRRRHPGYKRARKLLNDSFRKGKLPRGAAGSGLADRRVGKARDFGLIGGIGVPTFALHIKAYAGRYNFRRTTSDAQTPGQSAA